MGCTTSQSAAEPARLRAATSYSEVSAALADAGLGTTQLVFGFDFSSASNGSNRTNFVLALRMFCGALEGFQQSTAIHAYGFGDLHTRDELVFSFHADDVACKGPTECWQRLMEIREQVVPWGLVSIAPVIRRAVSLVNETRQHHTLVIVLENELDKAGLDEAKHALEESAKCALSVVIVGIGRCKWHTLEHLKTWAANSSKTAASAVQPGLDSKRSPRSNLSPHMSNVQMVKFDDHADFWQEPANFKNAFLTEALARVPDNYKWAMNHGQPSEGHSAQKFWTKDHVCNPPDQPCEQDPWYGLPDGFDAYWDARQLSVVYVNKRTRETSTRPFRTTCSSNGSTPRSSPEKSANHDRSRQYTQASCCEDHDKCSRQRSAHSLSPRLSTMGTGTPGTSPRQSLYSVASRPASQSDLSRGGSDL